MELNIKICKIGYKKILWVFLFLNLVVISCMIATLAIPDWCSFSSSSSDISKDFKGKLLESSEISGKESYVNYINLYYACTKNSCHYWEKFYIAGSSYVIFESLSIFCTLLWSIILTLFLFKKDYLVGAFFFSSMAWMSHFIAIIVWISVGNANFRGDCHDADEYNINICAENGPILALSILIIASIVNIAFLCIGRIIILKKIELENYTCQALESESNIIDQSAENNTTYVNGLSPLSQRKKEEYEDLQI